MAAATTAALAAPAAHPLLDFSKPLDVPLLDTTVKTFYESSTSEQVRADYRFISFCVSFRLLLVFSSLALSLLSNPHPSPSRPPDAPNQRLPANGAQRRLLCTDPPIA